MTRPGQYISVLAAGFAALLATSAANAMSLLNSDTSEVALTVTVDGIRTEVVVAPNTTVQVCDKGCFIALPGGEMAVFKGTENVSVQGGKFTILEN